jgi:hypothetical protein
VQHIEARVGPLEQLSDEELEAAIKALNVTVAAGHA